MHFLKLVLQDQSNCRSKEDSSLNVKIDDKTFSAGNVAGVVKKVYGVYKTVNGVGII